MGPWAIISKDIYILCIFIFLSPVEATASMNFCRSATTQISTICLVAVFQRPKYGNQFKEGIKYKDVLVVKKKGEKKGKKKKVYLVVLIILILNTNALSSISTSSFYF